MNAEMHLKQPGFTYSVCGSFTRNKEKIEKFMQEGNADFIYRNELDKAYFQHDMAYGNSRELAKRTQSNKVLKLQFESFVKHLKLPVIQKMMVIKEDYLQWFTIFLIRTLLEVMLTLSQIINSGVNFIRFKRRKVYSSLRDNI